MEQGKNSRDRVKKVRKRRRRRPSGRRHPVVSGERMTAEQRAQEAMLAARGLTEGAEEARPAAAHTEASQRGVKPGARADGKARSADLRGRKKKTRQPSAVSTEKGAQTAQPQPAAATSAAAAAQEAIPEAAQPAEREAVNASQPETAETAMSPEERRRMARMAKVIARQMASWQEEGAAESTAASDRADAEAPAEAEEAAQAESEPKTPAAEQAAPEEAKALSKRVQRKAARKKKAAQGATLPRRAWRKLGDGAAAVIRGHDHVQAACDGFFLNCAYSLAMEAHDARMRYKGSSRRIFSEMFLLMVFICLQFLIFERSTVYEYAYNGRVLGYVKSQDTVTNVLDTAGERMSSGNDDVAISFEAGENMTFSKVSAANKDVDDADAVMNKITYMTDIETTGYGIYEDGKFLTVVETEQKAEDVLEAVQEQYAEPDEGMEVESVRFGGEVEIRETDVMLSSIQSTAEAEEQLTMGASIELSHIIGEDETVAGVAKQYGVAIEDMSAEDGETPVKELESGDIVVMQKQISPLTVEMVESGSMSEAIPYETERQETDELYEGETYVQQAGEDGRQIVTGKITKINGEESSRDIKKTEVVKEATKEIILVGTKDKPKTASTGQFAMPIRSYTISSRYGMRWGRMHEGIDFAASTGTPIYASDGGTVTKAEVYGGYGNCIIITHDNGTKTLYGHCSKLYVSEGDKVYQGQEIAAVGSTGRSTGPHLHFEIHVNGSAVDPEDYL